MKRLSLALLVMAIALLNVPNALADSITNSGSGREQGAVGGMVISPLSPDELSIGPGKDQLILLVVSNDGPLSSLARGAGLNLWFIGGRIAVDAYDAKMGPYLATGVSGRRGPVRATPTPEPVSLALLGSGLLVLAFALSRKAKQAARRPVVQRERLEGASQATAA